MNSIIRLASRIAARPILERTLLVRKPTTVNKFQPTFNKRWAHNQPLTYDFVRERILLLLRLFDKVDPEKLTLDSHFINDLGLDSLDHVEIIMHLEGEFKFDIPDKDAEMLTTPRHILTYITDREEAYEELQKLQAHDHHEHEHDSNHSHDQKPHVTAASHPIYESLQPHKRTFCTLSTMSKRYFKTDDLVFPTSFGAKPQKEVNYEEIQQRVMKVLLKYDKIDSSKLELTSHFVQDLGLDSLDHVEIMMELEDEFALEVPDQTAEKLMRPVEIARFVFEQEEKRSLEADDREL